MNVSHREHGVNDIEYYNEDMKLPVFMRHDRSYRFTVQRLCNILLDPKIDSQLICKAQPNRIAHNVTFVVDCSVLRDKKDLLADDLGVWVSKGSRKTRFTPNVSPGCVNIVIGGNDPNQHTMHRAWHTHGTSGDFRRLVVFIEGINDSIYSCIIVYANL